MRDLPLAVRRPLYIGVKVVHSIAFFILQTAILYLLYKALRGESDRRAAISGVLVGGECAVYAGNAFGARSRALRRRWVRRAGR